MQNGGVVLVNTSLVAVGSNVSDSITWNGANGCLVLAAQQLAPVVNLMLVGVGPQRKAVKVNSGALVADGVYQMPLPAGTYAIHSATGSSVGLFAALMPLP
jgi:hypothetical protein